MPDELLNMLGEAYGMLEAFLVGVFGDGVQDVAIVQYFLIAVFVVGFACIWVLIRRRRVQREQQQRDNDLILEGLNLILEAVEENTRLLRRIVDEKEAAGSDRKHGEPPQVPNSPPSNS